MLRFVVRAIIAVPVLAGGVMLLHSAWWLVMNGVWPEWRANGSLSLTGDAIVLNRRWKGNELYLLITVERLALADRRRDRAQPPMEG